ncbi:MAG: hypothetical protein ACC628_20180, partial [Pirellulaceae bacterium]
AGDFVNQACVLIQDRLPGVMLQTRVSTVTHDGTIYRQEEDVEPRQATRSGVSLLELPQARVCAYSGDGPASEPCHDGDEHFVISKSTAQRLERGRAFDRGETRDVLGILRPGLLGKLGFKETSHRAFPADFSELSTGGYLAVVHVDGNRVGSRFTDYAGAADAEDFFECWRLREKFYHTLRVGMRVAVHNALSTVFRGKRSRTGKVPLRLLMLGGDDLVMVCGATSALRFVVELTQEVRATTKDLPDGKGRITLGVGVAIVQDSFPFYRAYELADQLASSAKRLKASLPDTDGNVVDWLVTSEAWYGDVEATRRDQYVVDGNLVLSGKPYRILKSTASALPDKSLEELLAEADDLASDRVARNQLRGLADSLPQGRYTARFSANVLPENLKTSLTKKGYMTADNGPWTELPTVEGTGDLPKDKAGEPRARRFRTLLLDLYELY